MGAIGVALFQEGIHDSKFKGRFKTHTRKWFAPLFVLGFVALISIVWEWHEFVLDVLVKHTVRQANIADTMADFFFDLLGGAAAVVIFSRGYEKR